MAYKLVGSGVVAGRFQADFDINSQAPGGVSEGLIVGLVHSKDFSPTRVRYFGHTTGEASVPCPAGTSAIIEYALAGQPRQTYLPVDLGGATGYFTAALSGGPRSPGSYYWTITVGVPAGGVFHGRIEID